MNIDRCVCVCACVRVRVFVRACCTRNVMYIFFVDPVKRGELTLVGGTTV